MIHTRFKTSKRAASLLGLAALGSVGFALGSHGARLQSQGDTSSSNSPVLMASLPLESHSDQGIKRSPLSALVVLRRSPVPGAKPGSYEEMSRVLTRAQFNVLTPGLKRMARNMLLQSRRGEMVAVPCFAPGTPLERIRAFEALNSALQLNTEFRDGGRWTSTATNASIPAYEPFTLTWNLVPDGTTENGADPSDLKAWAVKVYGSEEAFRDILRAMYARYSELTGITYKEVDYDDGSDISGAIPGNPGVLGVRADIRVGGHKLDGDYNVLAHNYYPTAGDMIIDTSDVFFTNDTSRVGIKNVLAHEHGHGLGFAHVCPINETKLMEPFVSGNFLGPQLDDILNAQSKYGDGNEKGSHNEVVGTATPLGTLAFKATKVVKEVSISGPNDVDTFSFSPDIADRSVTVELKPVGPAYLEGEQNADATCTDGTPFDPGNIRNLNLQVLDSIGNTIGTSAVAQAGGTETVSKLDLPGAGPFFVRVLAADKLDAVQGYTLSITTDFRNNRPPVIENLRFTPRRPDTDDILSAKFSLSDPDGDSSTVTAKTSWTKNGKAISVTNDTIDLSKPDAGDYGDVFEITVVATDAAKSTATAKLAVTVRPPNVAPSLTSQNFTIRENHVLTNVIAGKDGNPEDVALLSYTLRSKPKNGTLVLQANGNFTYTPNTNFHGTESFIVRATDPDGLKAEATYTITVTPINYAPILTDDVLNAKEDVPLNIAASTLLANDNNGEAKGEKDEMKIIAVTTKANFPGTLVLNVTTQNILFTPKLNWNGEAAFKYTVQDSAGNKSTANVVLKVAAVNDAPTADDLTLTTIANTTNQVELTGDDVEGDVASFSIVALPKHGKAKIIVDGDKWILRYTPATDYVGTDLITYASRDGFLSSTPAKIAITVTPNSAPTLVSLTPNAGKFNQGTTVVFVQKVNDKNGTAHLDAAALVISSTSLKAEAKKGAALWFDAQNDVFTISTDDGKTVYTPVALGGTIYNTQVSVTLNKKDVIRAADGSLTLRWRVTFKPGFLGEKTLWTRVEDLGGASAGFTNSGTITIVEPAKVKSPTANTTSNSANDS